MTIVSVIGSVDCEDVVFTPAERPDDWEIVVPRDTEDGAYAVYVLATNDADKTDSWSGWLYIFDSRPICLDLECSNGLSLCRKFPTISLSEADIDRVCLRLKDMKCNKR